MPCTPYSISYSVLRSIVSYCTKYRQGNGATKSIETRVETAVTGEYFDMSGPELCGFTNQLEDDWKATGRA
jgi:hypothetical protein